MKTIHAVTRNRTWVIALANTTQCPHHRRSQWKIVPFLNIIKL